MVHNLLRQKILPPEIIYQPVLNLKTIGVHYVFKLVNLINQQFGVTKGAIKGFFGGVHAASVAPHGEYLKESIMIRVGINDSHRHNRIIQLYPLKMDG